MDLNNWVKYCYNLRNRVVRRENLENQYLLANFIGTSQQQDIEKRTQLIGDFFRIKINVKAFDDEETAKQGKSPIDFRDDKQVFSALKDEFDMPYWAFISLKNTPLKDLTKTFIYQLKACNEHCLWCYVDDSNKDGKEDQSSKFFSMEEIMDVFKEERKKQHLHNFRPSGGEPTLAIEQWLEALREIENRRLKDVYVQADTNLTTGHFIEDMQKRGIIRGDLLFRIGDYPQFGVLCSFKGTDIASFLEATGLPKSHSFLDNERWYTFEKLVRAGIDCYPFIYAPNPNTLKEFMEKGAKLFGDGFYLKTWIFPLKLYGPEKERLEKRGINSLNYQQTLDNNFNSSKEIMQELIWKKLGVNYQAIPRAGIELRVK